MKKSTKWILGSISVVLFVVVITCSGIAFLVFRTQVNKGFEQKSKELAALASELVDRNVSNSAVEVSNKAKSPDLCARSFAEDINSNRNGRNATAYREFEYIESIDARGDYEKLVDVFEREGFKSKFPSGSDSEFSFNDGFYGSRNGEKVFINSYRDFYKDFNENDRERTFVEVYITSTTCYSDFPESEL